MTDKVPDYGKVRWRPVRWMFKFPVTAVLSHWVFQSMLYMDRTERGFKIALDALLTAALTIPLISLIPLPTALLVAFVLAHTLNFMFNGQFWGVLKPYGFVHIPEEGFNVYVSQLRERARQEPAIDRLLVYGSVVRGEWHPSSDLDGRILRKSGFLNGIRACWFLLLERSRALFLRFPIDVYVIDDPESLQKLRQDETGTDLIP